MATEEEIREPEELEPKCPQCGARMTGALWKCSACGYELTPEQIGDAGAQSLAAFYERERRRVQPFEVRYRAERPAGVDPRSSASHWAVIGYAGSRQDACIIASALHREHGWRMEVWCLDPLHKDLGPRQLMDRIPDPKSMVPCTCEHCQQARATPKR